MLMISAKLLADIINIMEFNKVQIIHNYFKHMLKYEIYSPPPEALLLRTIDVPLRQTF